ncbi:MAG TPA: UDP-2,3-diacylglucosamine diphosphatase [Gemmatimonadaceae bacterium]|nr:UDP-2,3-diacylglucosamine diphosphatase [Gemmatimonadaceae bacterium]
MSMAHDGEGTVRSDAGDRLASPCVVISDTHLGARSHALERQLVDFLRALPGRASSLLINGDLFDFWFEWRSVMPRGHFRLLAALADLVEGGTDVLMIAGNHDCWGGDVLTGDVGMRYHVGSWRGSLAGWDAEVEHGDGLRVVEDRRYRLLRRVIRHGAAVRAFRWLHPDVGTWLARGSSETSRAHRALDGGRGLQEIAVRRLGAPRAPELLIFGHSHAPTLHRAPSGGVYANAGSWLDAPTYLLVAPDAVELRRWSGSVEGDLLDALERRSEKALPQR